MAWFATDRGAMLREISLDDLDAKRGCEVEALERGRLLESSRDPERAILISTGHTLL
jgi:hypothetical protein